MFNAPRPAQPYGVSSTNGFGGSFVHENPLASSVYDDGLDPWSAAPSPAPPPLPSFPSASAGFTSVIGDATVPVIYNQAFAAVDDANTGETSVNALSRVLGTSALPASTIDKIVSLVSSRPRVSKLEFIVALALVALAQSGKDISVERVAALAQENTLPVPSLDLGALVPSASSFGQYQNSTDPIHAPVAARAYPTGDDPWNAVRFSVPPTTTNGTGSLANGAPSSISGTGLPREWWKKQETVYVNVLGQQGFILNRYLVYEISTDVVCFLWDCLVRRYPFRLLPALPPKRVGPDEGFLEQRRKGLARFLNFVINHPIIKEDALLAVFLTEPSLEAWRKHTAISYEEESVSKRVDRVEEMSIPSDLDDKLACVVRGKIENCLLGERIIRRREAEAVRLPLLRRPHIATYLPLPSSPLFSPASSASSADTDSATSVRSMLGPADVQADVARLTNTNERCWRGDGCELCAGVRQGLGHVAAHTQKHADSLEHRSQRDLYIAMRDLFIRRDRLSIDQVERLKKRVEANSLKLEAVKQAQKDGWETEADRIAGAIEKDQAAIAAQLSRRVFIRACMWHELRVVLHNRENALVTQTIQAVSREEHDFTEGVANNWASLREAVESMPFE
ncbi:hypothetical protein B0H21DRAFT_869618 [Amylocystis lapponica]|nr:hypothetical protein B0H21DRAFT_869618 [Amylocystis lapponica]